MADKKISELTDGDAQITGVQGRVDVPVTIGTATFQIDEAVLNTLPPIGVDVNQVLFTDDTPLVIGNTDLTFLSETDGATQSGLLVTGPAQGALITAQLNNTSFVQMDAAASACSIEARVGGADTGPADVAATSDNGIASLFATGGTAATVNVTATGGDATIEATSDHGFAFITATGDQGSQLSAQANAVGAPAYISATSNNADTRCLLVGPSGADFVGISSGGPARVQLTLTSTAHQDDAIGVSGFGLMAAPVANKISARVKPFTGTPFYVQPGMWDRQIVLVTTGSGSGGHAVVGDTITTAGTAANVNPLATNPYTTVIRQKYSSVVTTANQSIGIRASNASLVHPTSGTMGGFLFVCQFGFENYIAGDRLFVGTSTSNTPCAADPSALTQCLGFGIDAADSAITFMHNDTGGTATKDTIAGQPALANNQGYRAYIYWDQNVTGTVNYRLDDLNAGTTIIDTSTSTNLPTTANRYTWAAHMGNAANVVAADASIGVVRVYIEIPN